MAFHAVLFLGMMTPEEKKTFFHCSLLYDSWQVNNFGRKARMTILIQNLFRVGGVVDVTTLKMARKKKENLAGCAGEGKQSKGNKEKRKMMV